MRVHALPILDVNSQQPIKLATRAYHGEFDESVPAKEFLSYIGTSKMSLVSADLQIDNVYAEMLQVGLRALLAVNSAGNVSGLITTEDIKGERPVVFLRSARCPQRVNVMMCAYSGERRHLFRSQNRH